MLLPMMREAGYPLGRSSGLMAAGGIIAPIIPPSIPLIIIGVAGSISITKLFLAGIVPGLIMGVTLVLMWLFMTRKEDLVVAEKATGKERLKALRQSFWAMLLPVIIIGGIKTGIFTPTEAGVVAAVYAILVSTLIYRELSLAQLYQVLVQAARSTAVVMFLIAAASVASWLISIAQLPMMVADLLSPLADDPRLLMLAIMAIVLIVGMVMDLTPTIRQDGRYRSGLLRHHVRAELCHRFDHPAGGQCAQRDHQRRSAQVREGGVRRHAFRPGLRGHFAAVRGLPPDHHRAALLAGRLRRPHDDTTLDRRAPSLLGPGRQRALPLARG
jgi:hypothetical protein